MGFLAALFDMDGTLIDSMGVWARVDKVFFERRGLALPEDYVKSISGMSFRGTAEYTKRRFELGESVDDILSEWDILTYHEYAENVSMKPFAKAYIERLAAENVKLAVVTALPDRLYAPVLKRHGVYDMFGAFCSTHEASGDKRTGEIYLLAAQKLNVRARDCAVFEDIYEGLAGAKRAGMRAVCVFDAYSAHAEHKNRALCDRYINSFEELLTEPLEWED